jgi:peroxiredoxin
MNIFSRCFCFIFLFAGIIGCTPEEKKTFPVDELQSISVTSLDGNIVSVRDLIAGNHVSVFYFLMPGCPMCESYSLPLNELDAKFSGKGISFFGIFSSPHYSSEEINSFRNDFKIEIPFYRDVDSKLAYALGATVTPEVFVLDSTAAILYKGSIDDLAYATGKTRMEATEFFLNDALQNIVSGKPVAVKETVAYGCIIE